MATGVDSPFEGTMSLLSSKPGSVDLEGYLFPDTYAICSKRDGRRRSAHHAGNNGLTF